MRKINIKKPIVIVLTIAIIVAIVVISGNTDQAPESAPNYHDGNWEQVEVGQRNADKYGSGDPVYEWVYTGEADRAQEELQHAQEEYYSQLADQYAEQYAGEPDYDDYE
jgi:hypothetical protein